MSERTTLIIIAVLVWLALPFFGSLWALLPVLIAFGLTVMLFKRRVRITIGRFEWGDYDGDRL